MPLTTVCIAFGLQPDENVSELHLLWSCCGVCTEKLRNNLRELTLQAAHSCLTWTVTTGEHFIWGSRPELWLLLSSIIEGLGLFQHSRREAGPETAITINWHKQLWRALCIFLRINTNVSGVAKWWKIRLNWPTLEGSSRTPLATEELGFQFHDHVMGVNHESWFGKHNNASPAGISLR